ncbi:microfibril-associated glycoprotein 4-like [Strongylocentrotus purpuratus]|uniref:Uncharacterized protein n=1 Tax=Strongylocentrotus purpuratus TaxID=7668 RepID=A0A7M7SVG8_STRPU|nr:microfibril-associated glycoprotein 4-like [Strongylocentrotus purpuratus]
MTSNLKLHWKCIYGTVIFLSVGLPAPSDAMEMTQTCCKNVFGLNYTLPMFNECQKKQNTNGSMVQMIPKLITAPMAANGCPRRKGKLGIPPGYRTCKFPDCDKKLCENGWCEETMESYLCHCSPGFQGKHCNEQAPSVITDFTDMSTIIPAEMTQVSATDVPIFPRDCAEIQTGGLSNLSGVYPIYPDGVGDDPLFVYCDMETDGGRWTVFQRRQDGSVDFSLSWSEYKHGFGNVSTEHWLGNDNIHRLSRNKTYELRIDLEDFEGQTRYATYSDFNIANETANYILAFGNYFGDAGDSLRYQYYYPFTTWDRDNDFYEGNCASYYQGGWWYHFCHYANLNGQYLKGPTGSYNMGVVWDGWRGLSYSLKKTEMKLRPT